MFEHKYRPIYSTPRQLLRYISRQLEETPADKPLPSILTVVLLQSGSWKRLHSLSGEYDLPEPARRILTPYLVDFRMVVVELAPLQESDLKGTEAGRLALALLKTVGEGQPMGWLRFRTILSGICRNLPPEELRQELRRALYYLTNVMDREQEGEVRQALQQFKVRILYNAQYAGGEMLSSVQAGITAARQGTAQVAMIVLGDQPQIQPEVVRGLLQRWGEIRSDIVIPSYQMRRGHPWLVSRSLWEEVLDLRPPGTLRSYLATRRESIDYLNVQTDSILSDLDTPDEYERQRPVDGA